MSPIKKSTLFLGVAVLAGIVAAVKFFMPTKIESEMMKTATATTHMVRSGTMNTEAKQVSVNTSYSNPGGKDDVSFSLYVDSTGMIVDARALVLAKNENSKKQYLDSLSFECPVLPPELWKKILKRSK